MNLPNKNFLLIIFTSSFLFWQNVFATIAVKNQWGMDIPGIKTRLATQEKVIALTLDACGRSSKNKEYDQKLIDYLIRRKIPATLFFSGRWIDHHKQLALQLAKNPLFEIENHGLKHKPLSIDGKSAYGIAGTRNAKEAKKEIEKNGDKVASLVGHQPRFFRSGTAHCDEAGVKIANELGYQVVNFTINGDFGATASKEKIVKNFLSAKPGAIIICHMNHPEGQTAEGVMAAIPLLEKSGYRFVLLANYELQ